MTTATAQRIIEEIAAGNARRAAWVQEITCIALSDDDAETRERRVRGALARLEAAVRIQGMVLTAGANRNIVDDNSIEHGGVSGWNR